MRVLGSLKSAATAAACFLPGLGGAAPAAPARVVGPERGPVVAQAPQEPAAERTLVVKLWNTDAAGLVPPLQMQFQGRARIAADPGGNALIIRGRPDTLDAVRRLVEQLDRPGAGAARALPEEAAV